MHYALIIESILRKLSSHGGKHVRIGRLLFLNLSSVLQFSQLSSPFFVHLLLEFSPLSSVSLTNLSQHIALMLLSIGCILQHLLFMFSILSLYLSVNQLLLILK